MKNLIKALSEFQNECPIIHKDTKGHNYTYADLPQIFSVINPLLNKHKLCFTQLLENDGIRTILFHVESGEQLESFTTIPLVKLGSMNEYQSYGAAVSYFRRYCLSSCLGLVTDKDTDAAGQSVSPSLNTWIDAIARVNTIEDLEKLYDSKKIQISGNKEIIDLFTNRKNKLTN
jgi:hypothetical protein